MTAAAAAAATPNRSTLTTPSDREIRVERIFNAPPGPALVAQW